MHSCQSAQQEGTALLLQSRDVLFSGWASSQLCASKTCSLLCFRGDSTEALLTATFCCPFSTADTSAFSQETTLLFVLLIGSEENRICCLQKMHSFCRRCLWLLSLLSTEHLRGRKSLVPARSLLPKELWQCDPGLYPLNNSSLAQP